MAITNPFRNHVFADCMKNLQNVIVNNNSEIKHIERCQYLAKLIKWNSSSQHKEFTDMLGNNGIKIFQEIIDRIKLNLSNQITAELLPLEHLIEQIMYIHDLGKFDKDKNNGDYNGVSHEERSFSIIESKRNDLTRIEWQDESISMLSHLARYHALLGITRTGEASMMFLSPIVEFIQHLNQDRKRLFLDLLILLTCCDSGASGNFDKPEYFLDYSRIKLYNDSSNFLLITSSKENISILGEISTNQNYMEEQIERIITSGSLGLSIDRSTIKTVLRDEIFDQNFRNNLVKTRFDHGFYVFEELLFKLNQSNKQINDNSLWEFLNFIKLLFRNKEAIYPNIINFRDSFSIKSDLEKKNRENFESLLSVIQMGNNDAIDKILIVHKESLYHLNQRN